MKLDKELTVKFIQPGDRCCHAFGDSMMFANIVADEEAFEIELRGRHVLVPVRMLNEAREQRSCTKKAVLTEPKREPDDLSGYSLRLDDLSKRVYRCGCTGKGFSAKKYRDWEKEDMNAVQCIDIDGVRPFWYPKSWKNGVCDECGLVIKIEVQDGAEYEKGTGK
jgi:hypothetical protein